MEKKKTTSRHKWTYEECKIVCIAFKTGFVDSCKTTEYVIKEIQKNCHSINKGSIRMKISNTVCICNELEIKHTCSIASLSNYSQQHIDAFKEVFGIKRNEI